MDQVVCSGCATPLPQDPGHAGRPRRWCSRRCLNWAIYHPHDFLRANRKCKTCSVDISNRPTNARYCSNGCRPGRTDDARVRTCSGCSVDISARPGQAKYCSRRCNEIAAGKRLPELPPLTACALLECGATFQPWKAGQRCCSEKHSKLLYNRESRADGRQKPGAWNDKRRDSYHRRRALKKAASTGEPVLFAEIAARDNWLCSLCGKPVDSLVKWPDSMSPSMDHVMPLSRGGAHDPSNVALAHLGCNTAKNNRIDGELPQVA